MPARHQGFEDSKNTINQFGQIVFDPQQVVVRGPAKRRSLCWSAWRSAHRGPAFTPNCAIATRAPRVIMSSLSKMPSGQVGRGCAESLRIAATNPCSETVTGSAARPRVRSSGDCCDSAAAQTPNRERATSRQIAFLPIMLKANVVFRVFGTLRRQTERQNADCFDSRARPKRVSTPVARKLGHHRTENHPAPFLRDAKQSARAARRCFPSNREASFEQTDRNDAVNAGRC